MYIGTCKLSPSELAAGRGQCTTIHKMQMLGNECITCLTFVPPSSSFCLVYRLWLDSFLPEYLHASALTVSNRVSRVAACRDVL